MQRLTTNVIAQSFTVPAGVTQITIHPCDVNGNPQSQARILTVVPNTTYILTINSVSPVVGNSNTFGSLYTWTGSAYLLASWVE